VKDYTSCGGTITITYNGKDLCERDLVAGPYVINVDPAPTPVFYSIENADITCEDLGSYVPESLGYSNGIEGPCGINGEVQGIAEQFEGSCGTFEVNFSYVSCGVEITAKQTIKVIDNTAPTFNGELPQNMTIECGSDIPEAAILTASDTCSDATVEYTPEEEITSRECKADDAGNHTLWISNKSGLGASSKNWTATQATSFEQFSNGTAKLTGTSANVDNSNQIFQFVVWFKDASTYNEWTSTPNAESSTGYRQPKLNAGTTNGATLDDAQTWTYYLMDESKDNKLVGQGDYAGVELSLSHNPSNLVFGLQYGQKASLQSNGLGVSTWIRIQGDYNGSTYNSNGDFNIALSDCVENPNFETNGQNNCNRTIVRTWEATDACGNVATHTQTITVSDTMAPVIDCAKDEDFGLVTEVPTNFANKAPYTDNCSASGETTDFTDSEITAVPGSGSQVGSEFRFIFEEGYILTFGDSPAGIVNDAPYYTGHVTDYAGNLLPQYGNFEMIFYFNNIYQDYSIVRNGEELGYGPMVDGLPSCVSEDWYVESVNGHNKALIVECGQSNSTIEYEFTRTFYASDDCGNVGECSVTYTWTTAGEIAREQAASMEENFEFFPTDRDPESKVNQEEVKIDFKAFPVPFDNEVTLTYEFDYRTNVTIEFFDTKGLLVLSETNTRYVSGSKGRTTFDLSRTSSQVFYVKLTTNQGTVTKKIVSSGKK
ncbi:T9SS type A sorting domain-containing protein, partial [Psychroserpens jangbogonensis]|uniref:T9SS type A sorting domain-containing protein n=1 Tax=Psychroserpens jangbogonensis TaxID=1484460 RepID=UPI00053DD5B9